MRVEFGDIPLALTFNAAAVNLRASELFVRNSQIEPVSESNEIAVAALDSLGLPVIIAGPAGTVTWSNSAAWAVLRRLDGLLLMSGTLTALDREDGSRLARSIRIAVKPPATASTVVIRRPEGRFPYVLTVAPLTQLRQAGSAIIVFRDPDVSRVEAMDRLRATFGLTTAEAEIASAVSQGDALKEIADARGVAVGTVRNQLKSIFAKLGVTRQIDVVKMVADISHLAG